mgnify:CR=1 FL=1
MQILTEHCTSCGQPTLTFTERGFSCGACGDEFVAPYFLRAVVQKWNAMGVEEEAKRVAKEARKAVKAVKLEGAASVVAIDPKVAALFTDDVPAVDPAFKDGWWRCRKCKDAPNPSGFPPHWKWKTEKGYRGHKCKG